MFTTANLEKTQQSKANLSPEVQAKIVADFQKNNSISIEDRRELGLKKALQAVQNKEKLSVDLIREFHRSFSPPAPDTRYWPPERCERYDDEVGCPGKFRATTVGVGAPGYPSEDVIRDVLSIIKKEKEANFQGMHGTMLVPLEGRGLNYELAIFQGTLPDEKAAIDRLIEEMSRKKCVVLAPRTNDVSIPANSVPSREAISSYIDSTLHTLVNNFNNDMRSISDNDEKLQRIAAFVHRCMYLHPFRDCNHRTLTLGLLNFLLLSNGLGYCPLKDQEMIFTISSGLQASLATIKSHITPIPVSTTPAATINDNTSTLSSIAGTKRKTPLDGVDATLSPSEKRRDTKVSTLSPKKDEAFTQELVEAGKQFNQLVDNLHKTLELLRSKARLSSAYNKVINAVEDLSQTLVQQKEFFNNPSVASDNFEQFKLICQNALQTAEKEAENQRGWHAVRPAVKGLIGAVATFTIIPALVVRFTAKRGYEQTFFGTPKTATSEAMNGIKQAFALQTDQIDRVIQQRRARV